MDLTIHGHMTLKEVAKNEKRRAMQKKREGKQ